MAQPQWVTPSGSLGTIAEGLFYQISIEAVDPDGGTVKYELVAGELPEGIQVRVNGSVEGTPSPYSRLQGVPLEVGENVTSKFAVRAYVEEGSTRRINDRTFEITVTGQDIPTFVTPAGSLGTFYDGDVIDIDIEFSDDDPNDTVTISVEDGELPPGLTLNQDGSITGYILPITPLPDTAVAGYDNSAFEQFPFDFSTRSINKNYQFTLKISDGKDQNLRTYTMYVISKDSLTADTTEITADTQLITADISAQRTPFIQNYPTDGDIGTYRHDNFFAYQFQGLDLDGDQIEYEIVLGDSSDIPPGLIFDRTTGWLTGYFPDQGATERDYEFAITVYKKDNNSIVSDPYTYTITVIGDIATSISWTVGTQIGTTDVYSLSTINNGAISNLYIEAITTSDRVLFYRLKTGNYPELGGVYNKLPQGLELLPSGNISGRVSFDTFALDGGTTTFDQTRATRLDIDPTTFDREFTFTVEAYSIDGLISVFRTFRITVDRAYNSPYESLYIEALPPQEDRDLVNSLLQNQDIIRPEFLYRPDDPYFGASDRVRYTHAFSLDSATLEEYVTALSLNHFRKKLILGEIKTAQALDADGNVVYEVVYSEVVDTGVNQDGESPPQTVNTAFPITVDGETVTKVYPNSLINMRDQVIDTVGQSNTVLPLWMTSKQPNGKVLGFTRAWTIAYTLPGKSEQMAYYIRTEFGEILNRVDFDVDRYILDRSLTKNWIPNEDSTDGGSWLPASLTTFDFDEATGADSTNLEDYTTFDQDSVRFITPVDNYEFTDEYNKYLVFPKTNIIE